jgi:sugar/nucleoside kinase (ribokinase family)
VPVLGEIGGSAWAGTPRPDSLVGLGWQGLLRAAEAGGPTVRLSPSEDPVLERADIVVVGIDDLVGPGPWETEEAADQLAPFLPRPGQQLALTAGARGGRLFLRVAAGWKSLRYEAAESRVVDWTGAGDVFLGAYLASAIDPFLAGDALSERLAFAATVAAMSIEGRGITAMPTRDEVRARLATIAG